MDSANCILYLSVYYWLVLRMILDNKGPLTKLARGLCSQAESLALLSFF